MPGCGARLLTRRALLAGAALGLAGAAGHALLRPRAAPDSTFRLVDGRELRMADLRGRPVLVTFWATTCGTCVAETPKLASLYRELAPRGFEMIAVAMPYDPPYLVVDFTRRRELPYPVALDVDGSVVQAFGDVQYTPTTFVIAPDGAIADRLEGAGAIDHLRERLQAWLGDPASRS